MMIYINCSIEDAEINNWLTYDVFVDGVYRGSSGDPVCECDPC